VKWSNYINSEEENDRKSRETRLGKEDL